MTEIQLINHQLQSTLDATKAASSRSENSESSYKISLCGVEMFRNVDMEEAITNNITYIFATESDISAQKSLTRLLSFWRA